jgi:O-acetyl-ADP-ribose deacetylase (regulator of RNase III)
MPLRLFLIDADPAVATALRIAFESFKEVAVSHGDLLGAAHTAVVSPANSFGFMDGGIDAAYRSFFGPGIEERAQSAINMRPEGHLPVGASLVVDTGNPRVPFMVVAPTMLSPEAVESMNCSRAMRAVLRVAGRDERIWPGLFCPGLGTGVGQVSPDDAARGMAKAYGDWKAAAEPADAVDRAGG